MKKISKIKICDIFVPIRNDNGMFNASAIISEYNSKMSCDKKVSDWERLEDTGILREQIIEGDNGRFQDVPIIEHSKSGERWFHPYLLIDFMSWLDSKYEYYIIKFVYDQLVQFRHDAGDNFKIIQAAITRWRPTPRHRAHLSKALNCIVFGKHGRDLRNKATEEQLQTLSFLERKYADLVNEGYIRNYNQLIEKLRVEWNDRQKPF